MADFGLIGVDAGSAPVRGCGVATTPAAEATGADPGVVAAGVVVDALRTIRGAYFCCYSLGEDAYPAAVVEVDVPAVEACLDSSFPKILLSLRLNLAIPFGLSPRTASPVSWVDIVDSNECSRRNHVLRCALPIECNCRSDCTSRSPSLAWVVFDKMAVCLKSASRWRGRAIEGRARHKMRRRMRHLRPRRRGGEEVADVRAVED